MDDNVVEKFYEKVNSQTFSHTLIEQIGKAVVVTDLSGHIVLWNKGAENLYGWQSKEVLGKQINDVLVPKDDYDRGNQLMDKFSKGESWEGLILLNKKNGDTIQAYFSDSPVYDDEDNNIGIIGVSFDITGYNQFQETLRYQDVQFAYNKHSLNITTLIQGIAHEFNNQLVGVVGSLSILNEVTDLTENEYEKLLTTSMDNANRMKNLIQQLQLFIGNQPIMMENVDINELIETASLLYGAILESLPKIKIHFDLNPIIPIITLDRAKFETALFNLILNAIDAIENEGTITISNELVLLDILDHQELMFTSSIKKRNYVKVTVEDDGIGMSRIIQDQVLMPFYSMWNKSGMGLSLVKGIMEVHNGGIDIQSNPRKGTKVSLYFPMLLEEMHKSNGEKGNIKFGDDLLLVDPNGKITPTIKQIIDHLDYNITITKSSKNALKYLKSNTACSGVFINMLTSKNYWYDLYTDIKKSFPDFTIIFIGNFNDNVTLLKESISTDNFISIPFTINDVRSVLYANTVQEIRKDNLC